MTSALATSAAICVAIHLTAIYLHPDVPWYYTLNIAKTIGSILICRHLDQRTAWYCHRATIVKHIVVSLICVNQISTIVRAGPYMALAAALLMTNTRVVRDAYHIAPYILITIANLIIITSF